MRLSKQDVNSKRQLTTPLGEDVPVFLDVLPGAFPSDFELS